MMLWIARTTQTDYRKMAQVSCKSQFLTIPYSHYVEFARWALDLSGTSYQEQQFAPAQHVMPLLALRVANEEKHLSESSYVEAPTLGERKPLTVEQEVSRRATAVPALCLPDGRVLTDSWSIVKHCDFAPIDPSIIDLYDKELGPLSRQYAYKFLLKSSNSNIWNGLCSDAVFGTFWKYAWAYGVSSRVTGMLSKIFKASDEALFVDCKEKLEALFRRLDDRLRTRKGAYLGGENLGMEDLALCAFAAPVVAPKLYCRGQFVKYFDQMEVQDEEYRAALSYWRGTETGKYVLNIYSSHRL